MTIRSPLVSIVANKINYKEKKTMKKIIVLALALTLLIALTSCFAHEHSYGEWEEMTLRDRSVLGENKKTIQLTLIGNFVLNEWDGQRYPQVKIKEFYSEEYVPVSKNKIDIDDDFLF